MNWVQERFEDIRIKLTHFLVKQAGFKEVDLTYVPCSGLVGENLTKRSTEDRLTSWYNGCSLVEAIGLSLI
jgi:elongation factor 1 alpha-like protein